MTSVLLNKFYDTVNTSVGPTLAWVFGLLLFIELVYVMAKYLGTSEKK